MDNLTSRLAGALEELLLMDELEMGDLSLLEGNHPVSIANQALEEYRNQKDSARQELVPLDKNELLEISKKYLEIDDFNDSGFINEICSTFGIRQVSVEEISKAILAEDELHGGAGNSNTKQIAKAIHSLIYRKDKS